MTPIKFYYMPESPPCRLVEIVASLAGVTLDKNYVNLLHGEQLKDYFLKINPRHKVPMIIDGGVKITESRAIACYLVNKYMDSNNTLYPTDPDKRAIVDELLYMDIGTLYQSSSDLFAPIIQRKAKKLDQEAEKKFRTNIQMMDSRLQKTGNKFFTGDQMTIADISIAVSLQLSQAFDFDLTGFKNIPDFLERVEASIPNYKEICQEPMANCKKFIKNIISG